MRKPKPVAFKSTMRLAFEGAQVEGELSETVTNILGALSRGYGVKMKRKLWSVPKRRGRKRRQ